MTWWASSVNLGVAVNRGVMSSTEKRSAGSRFENLLQRREVLIHAVLDRAPGELGVGCVNSVTPVCR
jgi:hypothetical protein